MRKSKVDKILLDTNILLDYLLMREPFYDNASEIVRRCVDGIYRGCVAAHSISNMFFILKKDKMRLLAERKQTHRKQKS